MCFSKKFVSLIILLLFTGACSSNNSTITDGGNTQELDQDIPELGNLVADINGTSWQGEVFSSSFSGDMYGQELIITFKNSPSGKTDNNIDAEVFLIIIKSNIAEQLNEMSYYVPQFKVNYREVGAVLPDDVWVAVSGWTELIEVNQSTIKGVFEGTLRQYSSLNDENSSGETLTITDGAFNVNLPEQDVPDEEFLISGY